jgi:hypothetical protein
MITVRLSGGMGNQMFQYACGRALSLKYNTDLQLDTAYLLDRRPRKNFTFRDYDLDVFNITADVMSFKKASWKLLFEKGISKLLKPRGVEKGFAFDPAVLRLGPNVLLQGYWQSPHYFSEISDTVREDFSLKGSLSQESKMLLEEIKNTKSVCVHVRRGDYVRNVYHDIGLEKAYYDRGLRFISDKKGIGKVYIFSDDLEWCKEHLKFPFETMYVGQEYAGKKGEGHLILMSNCKHFIIPNSTFSWWAAWLCTNPEKIVIAPKQWFADDTIDSADLIPEEWVRI